MVSQEYIYVYIDRYIPLYLFFFFWEGGGWLRPCMKDYSIPVSILEGRYSCELPYKHSEP